MAIGATPAITADIMAIALITMATLTVPMAVMFTVQGIGDGTVVLGIGDGGADKREQAGF